MLKYDIRLYGKVKFQMEVNRWVNKRWAEKKSNKDFNVNVSNEDTILTLSTCANNNKYRVVLHSVRVK